MYCTNIIYVDLCYLRCVPCYLCVWLWHVIIIIIHACIFMVVRGLLDAWSWEFLINDSLVSIQKFSCSIILWSILFIMSNFNLTCLWLISYVVVQFFFVQLYYINFLFSRSLTSFVVGGRMAGNNDGAGGENLPPPPPIHPTLLEILRRSEESRQV